MNQIVVPWQQTIFIDKDLNKVYIETKYIFFYNLTKFYKGFFF